jgi:hypothetical protein
MSKKDLTEQEIRGQFIRPAIRDAGWTDKTICQDYRFTALNELFKQLRVLDTVRSQLREPECDY